MKKETLNRISKQQLELEYTIRKKSFRDLEKEYWFNWRTIKKLLEYYWIKIRYWKEAIKSQWDLDKWQKRREKSFINRKDKTTAKWWYIRIKDKQKYRVLEHRKVIEEHLWRLLKDDEIIHHKDKNKLNNSINNLEIMTSVEHSKLHYEERNKNKLWQFII